jgi:hypothetical protein
MSEPARRAGAARIVLVLVRGILAAPAPGDAASLLERADRSRPLDRGRMRLAWTSGEDRQRAEIEVLTDGAGSLLVIPRSGKLVGRRVLRSKGRAWLLLPGTRNPVPLTGPASLTGLASVTDLAELRLARDFRASVRDGREARGGVSCDVLDLEAAGSARAWSGGTLWIGAQDGLPRELRLRVASGRDVRSIEFLDFREDRRPPTVRRLAVRDLLRRKPREPDVIEVLAVDPGPVDPATFTIEGARAIP